MVSSSQVRKKNPVKNIIENFLDCVSTNSLTSQFWSRQSKADQCEATLWDYKRVHVSLFPLSTLSLGDSCLLLKVNTQHVQSPLCSKTLLQFYQHRGEVQTAQWLSVCSLPDTHPSHSYCKLENLHNLISQYFKVSIIFYFIQAGGFGALEWHWFLYFGNKVGFGWCLSDFAF